MRKLTKVLAGVAVAAIFTIGAAVPAQANIIPDPGASVPAKLVHEFGKWRQYMLVLPGRLFKERSTAGNLSWRSEVSAQRYAMRNVLPASAEGLNYMHNSAPILYHHAPGTDTVSGYSLLERNGGQDAKVLRGIEASTVKEEKKKWFTGAKPVKVKPTPAARFGKLVNGAFVGLLAAEFSPMLDHSIANTLGGWMGQDDAMGSFCESEVMRNEGVAGEFLWNTLNVLTGMSCSEQMLEPNPAWETMWDYTGNKTCEPVTGFCMQYRGLATQVPNTSPSPYVGYPCYSLFYEDMRDWTTTPNMWEGAKQHVDIYLATDSGIKIRMGGGAGKGSIGNAYCGDSMRPSDGTPIVYGTSKQLGFIMPTSPTTAIGGYLMNITSGSRSDLPSTGTELDQIFVCDVTLVGGEVLSVESPGQKLSDGSIAPPVCPAVPEGETVENVRVGEKDGDTLYDEDALPEYLDWRATDPECASGACLLDLRKMLTPGTSVSCFDLEEGCVGWFEDGSREQNYQCFYNERKVVLSDCFVYAGLFKPGRVEVGAPYSDPMTGEWSGGQSAPRYDRDAMSQRIQDPAASRNCTGMNVSGFDPVGFIMRPIQCALEWAFVPRPLVVEAEMVGGEKAWEKKPPKVIADVVSGFSVAPSVSGCSRSTTMFTGSIFQMQVEAWNFCPGTPGAMIATASRVATTAAMVVLVVIVVRRQIAGMVGYGAGQ